VAYVAKQALSLFVSISVVAAAGQIGVVSIRLPSYGSWPRGPFGSVRFASSAAPCWPATGLSTRRASCAARPRAPRGVLL